MLLGKLFSSKLKIELKQEFFCVKEKYAKLPFMLLFFQVSSRAAQQTKVEYKFV